MLYLITKRSNRYIIYLTLIFVFAVIIRFLYFPQNVYFSYDQARDFYFAQDILKGDIRLIGPPSAANQNLFPGPLPLYIYAFIQLLFGKSPEIMSIFFRIYNALGVFLVFRQGLPKITGKYLTHSTLIFLATISTYIIAEFKFKFKTVITILGSGSNSLAHPKEALYAVERFVHDSFGLDYGYVFLVLFLLVLILFYFFSVEENKKKVAFLFTWFLGGILPYFFTGTRGYYYSAGASVSLLILLSLLTVKLSKKYLVISISILLFVILNNFVLIRNQNPRGPNLEIVIQPGMLLPQEEKAIDFIYQSTQEKPLIVKALTVPLKINTTWGYLFEWYGEKNYGYLPVWSEKPAEGFGGSLPYVTKRSELPDTQFIIIEPVNGIPKSEIDKFFNEESYFTKLVEEKDFGTIVVQKRMKI